jgi:hypothetical protein
MKIVLTAALAATALAAGCAGLNTVRSDVSTFGEWPSGRVPGTYAFERLPSQQARAQAQDSIEAAARDALQGAGFKPAEGGAEPDVLVQAGARITRTDYSPWDDPLWWRGSFGYWRHGPWPGPRWGLWGRYDSSRYDREVALLIRDRASGKPLYEARASNDSATAGGPETLRAMYLAAMKDFPAVGINPRTVDVPLAK